MESHPVYIWHVEGYDVARIREVVSRSMREMGLRPRGRVIVKPNAVIAHPDLFPHAFTRAEFLDGVIGALELADAGETVSIAVGERCGITIPTRFAFANAGYPPVLERRAARACYFEEEPQVRVDLDHEGRLRDYLYLPEPLVSSDFVVSCPKFKSHPWTGVTFALKNWIGIQDDAHRLIDHDHALERKIADLHSALSPDFIAIDGIVGGKGRMLTPEPVPLDLVICGRNPVAVDATCCRILGIDPSCVAHVRLSAERGLGPIDERLIELRGDVTLPEARSRTLSYDDARIPVGRFFAATPIRAVAGPPPDQVDGDYCWGGCPGAVEEAIDIIKQVQPTVYSDVRPMQIVYGDCRGRYLAPVARTFFFGDCVRFDGRLDGDRVAVESTYVDRGLKDPRRAHAEGLPFKIAKSYANALLSSRRRWIVVRGCPVSVAEHVLMLAIFGGVRNPYFDARLFFTFVQHWISSRIVSAARRVAERLRR